MTAGLVPGELRMLTGLRGLMAELGARIGDAQTQQALVCANALLDELTLRLDHDYYRGYVDRGLALLANVPRVWRAALDAESESCIDQLLGEASARGSSMPELSEHIERLRECFERLVAVSAADGQQEWLARILDWEIEIYRRTALYQAAPVTAPDNGIGDLTREKLEAYLRSRFPERPDLHVTDFSPLLGGFQKLTVVFETDDKEHGKQAFVMRGEQPDKFMAADLGTVPEEFQVVRLLFEQGLSIPEPLWVETDAGLLGRRFMVSRKASGANCGTVVAGNDALSREAARALVFMLARIHALPLEPIRKELGATGLNRWLQFDSLAENTRASVHYWFDLIDASNHNAWPAFRLMYRWLLENAPTYEGPLALIHSDYGPHNVLVNGDDVTGIVDWELCRLGDPAQDVAYFLQCTLGQLSEEDVLAWYREAGGAPIDAFRLRYWEAYSTFQMLGGCFAASALYSESFETRNIWSTIVLKWKSLPLELVRKRIEAANAARRPVALADMKR
jgi:aminoglycoside phosphotransferase (APT) family kinase protein